MYTPTPLHLCIVVHVHGLFGIGIEKTLKMPLAFGSLPDIRVRVRVDVTVTVRGTW